MIKFGRMTNPGEDIVMEIEKTRRMGFDYVEIGIEAPSGCDVLKKRKDAISRSLKKFRHPAIGHTSWWYDLSSPYESVRNGWLVQAENDIESAHRLGIRLLNFHFIVPGKFVMSGKKSGMPVLNNYVESLNLLAETAKKKKMTIMLENAEHMFEHYMYVMGRCPKVSVHLDVGHAFLMGGMREILRYIAHFRNRIAHVHIHDNHGNADEHLALGKGRIKWKSVAAMLKKMGYDKTATFEVFNSDKDLIKSRDYFSRLWSS
ncbi:sugar phosphate isomerase/epimerase [Candidatus Woesearchaeota archaeon]|nr:sugar phosphate isomerase/epimerase [Candidatus Woesearchaeota archaeon]